MAAWLYEGDDNASSTDRQRDMVSFRINQARRAGQWLDDPRGRAAPPCCRVLGRGPVAFSRPVTEAIDQERRELFQSLGTMYEGYFVITATYFLRSWRAKVCRTDV
jgi:type IV secretion system protein VirB4